MYFSPATLAILLTSYSTLILAAPTAPQSANPALNKRFLAPANVICGLDNWGEPDIKNLQDSADRLRQKGGTCTTPAGQGKCTRVACNNTTGIWMCNSDTSAGPNSQPCDDIADYAWLEKEDDQSVQDILNQCYVPSEYHNTVQAGMAVDEKGTWTVIAASANCNLDSSKGPGEQS